MINTCQRLLLILVALVLASGCSGWQTSKNVWKTTRGLWNDYVSPPAWVDYDEKGTLPQESQKLAEDIMGIDRQLARLERVMHNADKPPSQAWLQNLMATFPWLTGFAGVKYDGEILGQEPADSLKNLDFIPLLYEDSKQKTRALRADVQPSPLGPEVMLAAPIFDGVDFLGIVVAYFDMRNLMQYSSNPQDIVIITPIALLWPGRYDFAQTPLAGTDWAKVTQESASGTSSNSTGSFIYLVRYLGNLPIIFAAKASGNFPEGDGSLEQGYAYFPQEREKLPPPPMPERREGEERNIALFAKPEEEEPEMAEQSASQLAEAGPEGEIQPGSRDSVLLQQPAPQRQRVQERPLPRIELDPALLEIVPPEPEEPPKPTLSLLPDEEEQPELSNARPSPFGPRREQAAPATPGEERTEELSEDRVEERPYQRPSPFGPRREVEVQPAPETRTTEESVQQPVAPAPALGAPEAVPETVIAPEESAADRPAAKEEPKAAESSDEAKQDQRQEEREAYQLPLLPGGRPSPFGPRN